MEKQKKKVNLFERVEITDAEAAQELYDSECKKLKFKLICTAVSLFSTVGYFLWKVDLGAFLNEVIACLTFAGWIATLLSSPLNVLKTIFKFAKFGWYIVPFFFIDIISAIVAAFLALYIFYAFPVVYCIVGVYQSYLNKTYAGECLEADEQELLELQEDVSTEI